MDLLRWSLALIGHIGLWCSIFNWTHSTALPRIFRKRTEKATLLAVAIPILYFLGAMLWNGTVLFDSFCGNVLIKFFLYSCILWGIYFVTQWLIRKLFSSVPKVIVSHNSQCLNLKPELGAEILSPGMAKAIGNLPFNECLKLALNQMTFRLDIPTKLDGLKICQLSDLHYTGHIGIEYFQRVVEEANKFEADIIVVTGDLVDEAECLPWLDTTLGKLRAKYGVYYVLGNHDLRIKDETGFRRQLDELGLIQASGQWHQIKINDTNVVLTGTELPWYSDVLRLEGTPEPDADLKICLSHSPDQLDWARQFSFDLMFAGHTHGGQIAFPILGPLVAPSKYGVRYASGTFQFDKMTMHVSRGISGDEPIRLCCLPELGLFTLQSSQVDGAKADQKNDQADAKLREQENPGLTAIG